MAQAEKRVSISFRSLAAGAMSTALLLTALPAEAQVGVAAAVNTDSRGRPPGGVQRVITLGNEVVFNEVITTDGNGLLQVLLLDGTTFTVGPNTQLTIDEFVYKPETGEARVVATLAKGAFRFIGGQTSRQAGGATIKTAAGTIGIRGAMVEGTVTSSREAVFSMIFGRELLLVGSSGPGCRIYKPGYTCVLSGGQRPRVRPRTKEDASKFQAALDGKTGQHGGATEQPNDLIVAESPLTRVNSALPATAMVPPPRPSPVQSATLDSVETLAQLDLVAQADVVRTIVESGGANPPPPQPVAARVLTAPQVYNSFDAGPTTQAGERGLVGSTPESDQVVGFVQQGGRLVSTDGAYNLPDLSGSDGDSGLQQIDVADGVTPYGAVSGPAYAGAGDFVAYLLGIEGEPARPFYALYGTRTPDPALQSMFSGSQLRHYALTPDPLRPSDVPFFAQDLYGPVLNFGSTDLFVIESNTGANFDTRVFQSWVDISGVGVDQKSAASLYVSSISPEASGNLAMYGARRGSFRYAATAGPANMRGGLGTIAGAEGGHFFGPNANNFLLGTPPGDGFFDSLLGPGFTGNEADGYLGSGGPFSTHHVAGLVAQTPQSALSRTTRQVSGFMTGLGESDAEGLGNPYTLASGGAPNFALQTNAQTNSVTAVGNVADLLDQSSVASSYLLSFGGGGTFIDDDRFGAHHQGNNQNTRLRTDGGQDIAHVSGVNPGSYLISGRANPIPGFQHCTRCTFIDWGWWGTRVRVGPNGGEIPSQRNDFVHMGTWVAGDISNPANLPNNISVTYSGTALGNVARQTADGPAKYIARGDMGMSFNFASRTGSLQISNFDGMNLSSAVSETSTATQARFGGTLSGSGVAGGVSGAFVNNGRNVAAGVIGNFSVTGSGVRAVGTIAGARAP